MKDSYTLLAERLHYPESKRLRSILQKLMSAEEAELITFLPSSVENISKSMVKSIETINGLLEGLFLRGVVFMTSRGYQFARNVTQLQEATASDMRLDTIYGRDLLNLWDDFSKYEWFSDLARSARVHEKPANRIVPVRRAIAPGTKILPAEDLNAIIEQSNRIAVIHCPCRRIAEKCSRPKEVCLQLNRAAEYVITRGTGVEVDRKEAMEILQVAEENKLVHTVPNIATITSFICNCCMDCCAIYSPHMEYGGLEHGVAKSRFNATVNSDTCTGCQDCVESCPFAAIDMVKLEGARKLKARVDSAKCYGCGICSLSCQAGAIGLVVTKPPEHIPDRRE